MRTELVTIKPAVYDFQRPDLCGSCKDRCCDLLPGETHPVDWGAPDQVRMKERLLVALRSGEWALDYWEGNVKKGQTTTSYYVRPATKDKKGKLIDPSWGGTCILLGEQGCGLAHDDRPTACRSLEPKENRPCKSHTKGKEEAAILWLEHKDLLAEVIEELVGV